MPANLDALGHDVHRLRMAVDDPEGHVKVLRPIAKRYGDAYHDSEVSELLSMCSKDVHVNTPWGVVRGHDAFAVVIQQEKEAMQIMWTTKFRPVTGTLFIREGNVLMKTQSRSNHAFKRLFARPSLESIQEHVLIDPETKKITFRSLTLEWSMVAF